MTDAPDSKIQAMIVGKSGVVADRIRTVLGPTAEVDIIHEAEDGIAAVSALRRRHVDVIFLDAGDPASNPVTTLTRLLKVDADAQVVFVSSLTFANVKNGMAGLEQGAAEFIQTPAAHTKQTSEDEFSRQILQAARELGQARRAKGQREIKVPTARHEYKVPTELRPRIKRVPKVIAIASSTGGPQALFRFFDDLPKTVSQPILVTQHMPETFTKALADHIARRTGWPCAEAVDGETIQGGHVYIAPGNYHLRAVGRNGGAKVALDQGPQVNYCRPSADPMIESLAAVYGAENMLVVVLTGMGSDGKKETAKIADAGGTVVVQDRETSVVWGMPGAVADAGACHAILPIEEIGEFVGTAAKGG